ncbi:UNVERIFIED_ORG: hypothetical protein ABRZ91_002086 [Heyndrickxia coagulans]
MTGFFFSGAGHFLSYSDKIKPAYARQVCAACLSFTKPFFPGFGGGPAFFFSMGASFGMEAAPPDFQLPKKLETTFFRFSVNESCKL